MIILCKACDWNFSLERHASFGGKGKRVPDTHVLHIHVKVENFFFTRGYNCVQITIALSF